MAYNTSLDNALRYASGLGSLTANTKPSLTMAGELWLDAFAETRLGVVAANLSATSYTAGSAFEQHLMAIESQLTSGMALLARESLSDNLRLSADKLIARARKSLERLKSERPVWLGLGAEANNITSGYAASHFVDDADPNFDFTPGGQDVEYAVDVVIQDGETF